MSSSAWNWSHPEQALQHTCKFFLCVLHETEGHVMNVFFDGRTARFAQFVWNLFCKSQVAHVNLQPACCLLLTNLQRNFKATHLRLLKAKIYVAKGQQIFLSSFIGMSWKKPEKIKGKNLVELQDSVPCSSLLRVWAAASISHHLLGRLFAPSASLTSSRISFLERRAVVWNKIGV